MENQVRWHAGKISDEQLKDCIEKIKNNTKAGGTSDR